MKKHAFSFGRFAALSLLLLVTGMFLVACGGRSSTESSEAEAPKATIKFADTQFESLWINNAVAQYVVKHGYGYPVESVELTTPGMQTALAKGDIDIQMETWEQNIQDWYDEEIGNGNIEDWGMTYEGGPQFFIIPKYIHEEHGINTVDDMKKHWKLFEDPEDKTKGAFQNCPIGWQCTEINTVKMEAYGLTEFYNIVSGGAQAALDAALKGAQLKKAPVFGYYWAPTSIMGAYDWHILEEPAYNKECWDKVTAAREDKSLRPIEKACAYETLPVKKSAHSGLKTKAPDLVDLFKKMNVGLEPINKTAAWAVEEDIQGDWDKAAVYYLRNFEDRWTSWMPEANAKKVKEALAGNGS